MMIGYDKNLSYDSYLKHYLKDVLNLDDVQLLYTNRFGCYSFTTVAPMRGCKNCEYINNYPHFNIPLNVSLKELDDFINHRPIYNEDFTLRYGDIHPNKPIPMLGQLRNLYVDDMIKGLIRTSGEINNIFTIGDISKKTINKFLDSYSESERKIAFETLYTSLMHGKFLDFELLDDYSKYCDESIEKTDGVLSKLGFVDIDYLRESELYKYAEIYDFIRNLSYSNGINENDEIKYFLQEFMFLLNPCIKDSVIINIIGQDQSEHIKKVLQVKKDNNLDLNVMFLTYNICKSAASRSLEEWSEILYNIIETNNIQIDDEKIEAFDFLRLFYAAVGTNQIIDFNIIKNINIVMFDKIFCSLSRRSLTNFNGFSLTGEQLIAKMALINQVYYNALISGNPSKVTRFLFDIMKAYNSVQEKEKVRDLYNAVVTTAMTDLSINKTKIYKRRGL